MTGVTQAVFMNQRSFGPQIGEAYGGGYYAGQISTAGNGVASHNLVVAPVSTGQSTNKRWKTSTTSTPGTSSVIDGPANSSAMNNADHPAAQFCEGLSIGGYTDWYMPAKNELEVCYYNLKPTTNANNTGYGANANAVPSRSSTTYTSGTPAQTSATDFKSGGSQAFAGVAGVFYWSSTEYNYLSAWAQWFQFGAQYFTTKTGLYNVRAVRRVAV